MRLGLFLGLLALFLICGCLDEEYYEEEPSSAEATNETLENESSASGPSCGCLGGEEYLERVFSALKGGET
ncbi:MAG TPA: hypothetical protein PLQ49_06845 [Methanothrix sp.]|nr:hypothetical protein [Methanothrix sp.]HRW83611.1 hypothetical protein [Methanothrix sp.]